MLQIVINNSETITYCSHLMLKYAIQYASKYGKLSSGHRTGIGQFSFQSQRKAMPKNAFYCTVVLISHASKFSSVQFSRAVVSDSLRPHELQLAKVMLKILQARLQQYVNCELPDVQAGFRKGRGTRDQTANI